jgi:hypothetical protein
MKAIEFSQANRILKAPPVEEQHASGIKVRDMHAFFDNTAGHWMSIWKPSAEELQILNDNGCIAAFVLGPQHPPIYIGAAAMDYRPEQEEPAEVEDEVEIIVGNHPL